MSQPAPELNCHDCGSAMARGKKKVTFEYKGASIEVDQPGWYCRKCGEAVLTTQDVKATEPAFVELKARVQGVLTPAEVRAIRTRLRLSQRRASALLGGGPRSFQKYESGTAMVSRPMSNLMRLLDKYPDQLGELDEVG